MDEQTIDASLAFGATMPLTRHGAARRSRHAVTLPRSTVLPRVEMVGAEPRLVLGAQRRYETVRRLGEGGFGEVLGARDNDIGRDVAVKRLHPGMRSPGVLARFAEEVRTIGSLEHPNIVPIHDVGVEENGDYYFVMKYVAGETLESIIDKLAAGDASVHARFGVERRVQIFLALLEAVAFAHSKGVLHRDIKPANVMVGAYGEVVLMDWGIAKRLRDPGPAPVELSPEASPASRRAATLDGIARRALPDAKRGARRDSRVHVSRAVARRADRRALGRLCSLACSSTSCLTLKHPLADKTTLPEMLARHQPRIGAPRRDVESPPPAVGTDGPELVSPQGTRQGSGGALRERRRDDRPARAARRGDYSRPVPHHVHEATSNRLGRFIDRQPFWRRFSCFAGAIAVIAEGVRAFH